MKALEVLGGLFEFIGGVIILSAAVKYLFS